MTSSTSKVRLTADALMTLRADPALTEKAGFADPLARYFVTDEGKQMTAMIVKEVEEIYIPYNLARFKFFMEKMEPEDYQQLLLLGCGYDTRTLWVERFKTAGVNVFENDFRKTF